MKKTNEQLIREYFDRGGTINHIPRNVSNRDNHQAPVLKKRNILANLKKRAAQ